MIKGLGLRPALPLVAVLVLVAVAVGLVMDSHWRVGLILFGAALIAASAFRALLSDERAGLLAVRGRMFDTVVLAVLGGALIVLAQSLASTA